MSLQANVLVTGGAGFIGSHLVERLLAEGRSVTVIDDMSTGRSENLGGSLKHPQLRLIRSRVSECPQLADLVAESKAVYHLAAAVGVERVLRSPIDSLQRNVRETEAILEPASRSSTPVLFASSSEVYGRSRNEIVSEGDDLLIGPSHRTRWGYACSKLMDEFLALAYFKEKGLPVVIARLFNTVGPRQSGEHGMVLPRFIRSALAGEPVCVFGDGKQTRCFSHVGDVVNALVELQKTPEALGLVVNVGSHAEISIAELAKMVIRLTGSPSRIEFVPYATAYPEGFEDMPRRRPDTTRLRKLTGLELTTPIEEVVRRTIEGFQLQLGGQGR